MPATYLLDKGAAQPLTPRQRITLAAMEEFGEKGLRGATMRSIAAAAGVSLGLVQHHFGTKAELREACDQLVLDVIGMKTDAIDEDRLGDPDVLATLMSLAPQVQRYAGRALVDGSPKMAELVGEVMSRSEEFLSSRWPEKFPPESHRTRDAGAVLTAINSSIMVLHASLAQRMETEPWTETAIRRIGAATLDAYEVVADMVNSDLWRQIRTGVDRLSDDPEEQGT